MRFSRSSAVLSALLALPLFLAGCAADFTNIETTPSTASVGNIQGIVHGGQQAISGAHVFVLEMSSTGYGGRGVTAAASNKSKSLLVASSGANPTALDSTAGSPTNGDYYVTSGQFGAFGITGDYTCDVGSYVYLYVNGGNPGLAAGTNNTGIGELIGLGICPAAGNLAATVPNVYINEVTTIATAYALAGYATDALHIGSSGTALSQVGLANAFATIKNIVDITTGLPYASHSLANSGTATLPMNEINTLSNILAACINTTSGTSTQCTTLFQNATIDGITSACTTACTTTDTASAAINIAHFPGANATTSPNSLTRLYGLQSGFSAFAPNLATAPNDFSVQIQYTGGGLTPQFTNGVGLAVDGSGNVWVANGQDAAGDGGAGTTISKFSPLGVPANATGYTGGTNQLSLPYGLAISADSAHVFIGNYSHSSIVDFNVSAGTGTEHILANGAGVLSLAFDSSGNLWAPDDNNIKLLKMNTSGTVLNSYTGNGMVSPDAIAISPTATGKVWLADSNGSFEVFTSAGAAVSNPSIPNQSESVALDSSGNAWTVSSMSTGGSVFRMNASGTGSTNYAPTCIAGSDLYGGAIDGASNFWIAGQDFTSKNATNNRICAVNNSGNADYRCGPGVCAGTCNHNSAKRHRRGWVRQCLVHVVQRYHATPDCGCGRTGGDAARLWRCEQPARYTPIATPRCVPELQKADLRWSRRRRDTNTLSAEGATTYQPRAQP